MRIGIFFLIMAFVFSAGCMKKAEIEQATPVVTEGAITDTESTLVEEATPLQTEEIQPQPAAPAIEEGGVFNKPGAEQIQQALQNAGLYQGKIDGKPGPMTKKAIEEFQAQNSLTADGKVGPKTWEKLAPYLTNQAAKAAKQ